ncbi:class I ribonucleotide reductase maintenance protein YfaE [Cysteiniphilum sp. QT6929]|uniref:class I ribonucleotide reductase maintenance protein YfaE n=1 Tax=Cysteiniphilum sp. QT6929 TaxID=2975055 RepID=UPI0024B325D1|nr:class I ribonucleotide reductase maintenance protein YfaE [Cysteiniphilum sp. QT6929]WHN66480.1 class I ribonucleotide reductase maintenance protein YfaE [Cysteiniphilum sp. QT6929]
MVRIKLNDQIITIDNNKFTILEYLEQQGIAANFQCRNGVCGTCRCQLISGDIQYIKEPLAFIKEDEVLICIARTQL